MGQTECERFVEIDSCAQLHSGVPPELAGGSTLPDFGGRHAITLRELKVSASADVRLLFAVRVKKVSLLNKSNWCKRY